MKTSIKAIILATAAGGLVLPAVTQASNFQYDGVELSYATTTVEAGPGLSEFDLDAAAIEINYSFRPNIVIGGGYFTASGNPDVSVRNGAPRRGKFSQKGPFLRAFYHADYNEKLAYQVGAGVVKIDQDLTANNVNGLEPFNTSDTSKSILGGIRYQYNEQIEFNASVDYDLDAGKGDDKLSYDIGARYQVMPDLDVGLTIEFDGGDRVLRASVKKYLDFSR